MKIPEKVDIDNAREYGIRCDQALRIVGQLKDEAIKALFKEENMTMEKLDKNIEIILREYYITGNQIIDYYNQKKEKETILSPVLFRKFIMYYNRTEMFKILFFRRILLWKT